MDCLKQVWLKINKYQNALFLLLIITWLVFYIFCGLLSGLTNLAESEFVDRFRALLNVFITSVVLSFTYKDRFFQYKLLAKITNGEGDLPKLPELFVPFALAIVPFTSAMTDLAKATESYELVMNLSLGMLFLVTLLETVVVCFFEMSRCFLRLFSAHVLLLIFIAWGALVDKETFINSLVEMGVLRSFV